MQLTQCSKRKYRKREDDLVRAPAAPVYLLTCSACNRGQANWGGGGSGDIIFTLAPNMLMMDDFNTRPTWYSENDIYFLEVCTLNEMCTNNEDIFKAEVGDTFRCQFDRSKWDRLARDLQSLG